MILPSHVYKYSVFFLLLFFSGDRRTLPEVNNRDNNQKYPLTKKENKKLKNKICTLKASQKKVENETLLLRKQLKQVVIYAENVLPELAKKNSI